MMAKYTKKAFNDIFNFLRDDDDFCDLFRKYWGQKYPGKKAIYENDRALMRREYFDILGDCIKDYLYNFDYLDKEYLDISWLKIKQYGRLCLVDLDTIYDIFKTDLREKLNEK